jgi:hypothetical protein
MLYDTCELIIQDAKAMNFQNFEFDLIRYFSSITGCERFSG